MLRKPEDTALYELDSRISAMERRLKNAKTARDSYLTFLKQKYPAWKPTFSANYSIDPGRNIVGELSTSNYHWDVGIEKRHRPKFQANKIQEKLYSKIPQGGPYLESDLKRVRQRLEEISQQLRLIRDTRLNLSTEDYLKSRHLLDENAEESFELETSNLANIRLQLENLNTDSYSPIETPTRDKIEDLKAEEFHETYIEDIKSGKVQPSYLISSEASGNLNQSSEAKTETSIEPRRVISFASQVPKVEEKIAEPERSKVETPKTKEEPQKPTSTYAQLLGLFGKSPDKKSDSDSDDFGKTTVNTTKIETRNLTTAPNDVLSKYLSRVDSSDSDDAALNKSTSNLPAKKIPSQPTTSLSKVMADADSDSDFFG